MNDFWTEDRVAELTRRWRAGETGTPIATALGYTRSAVLGKLNRLGLLRLTAAEVLRRHNRRVRCARAAA